MSILTIQIGSGSGAYAFGLPPDFRPRVETLRSKNGDRVGERRVWPVRGRLVGATAENVSAMWDEVVALTAAEDVDCFFKHGDAVLQTLSASEAECGPAFAKISVAADGGSGCAWDSKLEFDFEIYAEFYDASGDVIDSTGGTVYRTLEDGSLVQVSRGTVRTRKTASAKSAAETFRPTVPAGYRLAGEEIKTSAGDTEASYEYVLVSLFASLPLGVKTSERVETEEESGGAKRVTYRASFTGPGANRAAEEFLASGAHPVIRREFTGRTDEGRVDVVYTTLEPAGSGTRISFSESISLERPGRVVTEYPVDGRPPVLFLGAERAGVVVQEGSAVSEGSVPDARAPLEAPGLVRLPDEEKIETGEFAFDGEAGTFRRSWKYRYLVCESATADALLVRAREIISGG